MKKILLCLIINLSLNPVSSFANSGSDVYTPTKQEWAALWMNSIISPLVMHDDISITIVPDNKDTNTINVIGSYASKKISTSEAESILKLMIAELKKHSFSKENPWMKFKYSLVRRQSSLK